MLVPAQVRSWVLAGAQLTPSPVFLAGCEERELQDAGKRSRMRPPPPR